MHNLHFQRYLLTGILTVFPLWLTWVVFDFVLELLSGLSAPWVDALLRHGADWTPLFGFVLDASWLRRLLALVVTLAGLYLLGWLAQRVVGRRLIAVLEAMIERIPLVHSIYGGTKKLLAALQTKPDGAQRVVLIEFPHPGMKAIGFVTRIVREAGSERELATVYVPTTPNPTSGYLEVVPVESLTPTDWTVDQAMAFIISGGAVSPERVPYGSHPTAGEAPTVPPVT